MDASGKIHEREFYSRNKQKYKWGAFNISRVTCPFWLVVADKLLSWDIKKNVVFRCTNERLGLKITNQGEPYNDRQVI